MNTTSLTACLQVTEVVEEDVYERKVLPQGNHRKDQLPWVFKTVQKREEKQNEEKNSAQVKLSDTL